MKIGFDIDDILAQGMQALIDFHNRYYGTNYELKDIWDVPNYELWGGTKEIAVSRFKDFYLSSYFSEMPPINDAIANIGKLKDHELVIVTSRLEMTETKTRIWIEKYFPGIFKHICFASHHNSGSGIKKSDICHDLGLNLLVEDSLFHANDCAENGVEAIVLDYPWNQVDNLPKNVKRAYTWKEIVNIVQSL